MLTHSALAKSGFVPSALRDLPVQRKISSNTPAEGESLDRLMYLGGKVMGYPRRTEIVHEEDSTDQLYKVICGAVCTYKILSDGRRQIGGFYLLGDIFGLECKEGHRLAAETITNVKVLVIRRSVLTTLAGQNVWATNDLLQLTTRELSRAQDRVLLLSSKSAQERVVGFLFEMWKRASSTENSVELPMSRQDIADYLGLTIETVSRTLWALENSGAIKISSRRHIAFRDRPALMRMQQ